MINSVPLFDSRSPRDTRTYRSFFNIPLELIEQIEIVKSSQGVTYGANAMYGSINIITKSFDKKIFLVYLKEIIIKNKSKQVTPLQIKMVVILSIRVI